MSSKNNNRDITDAMKGFTPDNPAGKEAFMKEVYSELWQVAEQQHRRFERVKTYDPGALMAVFYEKLNRKGGLDQFKNRKHFLGYAAIVMRNFLIDYTRQKRFQMRFVSEDKAVGLDYEVSYDMLIDLNDQIETIKKVDPQLGEITELTIYTGANRKELAEAFGVSEKTIQRKWKTMRAMFAGLKDEDED